MFILIHPLLAKQNVEPFRGGVGSVSNVPSKGGFPGGLKMAMSQAIKKKCPVLFVADRSFKLFFICACCSGYVCVSQVIYDNFIREDRTL